MLLVFVWWNATWIFAMLYSFRERQGDRRGCRAPRGLLTRAPVGSSPRTSGRRSKWRLITIYRKTRMSRPSDYRAGLRAVVPWSNDSGRPWRASTGSSISIVTVRPERSSSVIAVPRLNAETDGSHLHDDGVRCHGTTMIANGGKRNGLEICCSNVEGSQLHVVIVITRSSGQFLSLRTIFTNITAVVDSSRYF